MSSEGSDDALIASGIEREEVASVVPTEEVVTFAVFEPFLRMNLFVLFFLGDSTVAFDGSCRQICVWIRMRSGTDSPYNGAVRIAW